MERKRAREEKDQEKVRLKREEHKAILKRTKGLLRWTEPPSTVVHEDVVPVPEVCLEPSTSAQGTDPLEIPLVGSGPLLVSLNPFPSDDEDDDEPPSASQFGRPTVQTETISQVTTKTYIQTPAAAAPATKLKAKTTKKVPQKVPSKKRTRPGTGALNYTPSKKDIREAQRSRDICQPQRRPQVDTDLAA